MKLSRIIGLVLMLTIGLLAQAQEFYTLTIRATTLTSESLEGCPIHLEHLAYGLTYTGKLDSKGTYVCTQLLSGEHQIKIEKEGFVSYIDTLTISANATIDIVLNEAVRKPYALYTETSYDPRDGSSTVNFSWNTERDYFFDDFESYTPFSIDFSPWTGKDMDKEQAAVLQGSYPNRGMFQYSTIFNPLTINPPVWYTYPVLRPYSGSQYVGFIRTQSGAANNDWLISPQISVGVKNVVRFLAKAGDAAPEKFQVYLSETGTEISDFKPLTSSNFEEVDYKSWKTIEYDLSRYEGKKVYIAIQYISKATFMLMIDDFYLGPKDNNPSLSKRLTKSASNPYERFEVFADNILLGTTENISYPIQGLTAGEHILGVVSKYRVSESDTAQTSVSIKAASEFVSVQLNVTANGGDVNGISANFINRSTGESWNDTITNNKSGFAFLPKGDFMIDIRDKSFETYSCLFTLSSDTIIDIKLKELITSPYNIRWGLTYQEETNTSDVALTWNKDYGWTDGFEAYTDFAQQFGGWQSFDQDKQAGYAISFQGSIVSFPGSTGSLPGIVFNANSTKPSMSADGAMLAPEGQKCIAFFSPQQAVADDWLISPKQTISGDYVLRFWAKSYDGNFLESLKICASTETEISSFELLDGLTVPNSWTEYEIDLSAYAGKDIYIAFNYCSYDKFILTMDNVYIGPKEPITDSNDGVEHYNIYLGNTKIGESTEPSYTINKLLTGTYQVGVQSQYESGSSPIVYVTVRTGSTDIDQSSQGLIQIYSKNRSAVISNNTGKSLQYMLYDVSGRCLDTRESSETTIYIKHLPAGVYVVRTVCEGVSKQQKIVID